MLDSRRRHSNEGNSRKPRKKGKTRDAALGYFWNSQSQVPLTRRALRELDRRNAQQTLESFPPVAPNFFVMVEGWRGTPAVAQRRTCHIGALGARAIHQLRSYGRDPATTYDNNAYAITIQYVGSSLPIYAHLLTPSSNSTKPIAYHMTYIGD